MTHVAVSDSFLIHASLCTSCAFVRHVKGRLDQAYLLCENEKIPAKYPRQPRLQCSGYRDKTIERELG